MRAWLFPGQGSQRRGMGAGVLDAFPDECATARRVLGFCVVEACRDDPRGLLARTRYLQPALFVVNALEYLARVRAEGEPDLLAGHSLGELNALHAAGCFSFETGLRLVRRRGEAMDRAAPGAMAAVVGLGVDAVRELIAGPVDLANDNSPRQVVLAGPPDALAALAGAVRAAGGRYVPLPVSGAFHSRYMRAAAEEFRSALDGERLHPPAIPVLSNVDARPYPPDGIADRLVRAIHSPVRWRQTMLALAERGVDRPVEIGGGTVLTGLWRECHPAVPGAGPAHGNGGAPATATGAEPAIATGPGPASATGADRLGSAEFRRDYGVRYAYLAGSMYRGISSADLVIRMGRAGLLGFFGAGGLDLPRVERELLAIRGALGDRHTFGMNVLHVPAEPLADMATVALYLRHGVRFVEAAGYTRVTPALVRFRFAGGHRDAQGRPVAVRRVVAKVSRPEVAEAFLSPPEEAVLARLERDGLLTAAEVAVARALPVSGDVCVEADSGGHSDGGVALTLLPAMTRLRDELMARLRYPTRIRVGASGGLGAPEAVAAAFVLGADFVLTGSINQCTPEAGTSALVKELLAGLDVQDTGYAPAGDLFELGARIQVVRRGTLFAARANKLYQLYRQHGSLDELDPRIRREIEERYFKRSIDEVWREVRARQPDGGADPTGAGAEPDPRRRMAMVFRWYFGQTAAAAIEGRADDRANLQVHCGPAMGALNRHLAGTDLADWRNRHVDTLAEVLMTGAARVLSGVSRAWTASP